MSNCRRRRNRSSNVLGDVDRRNCRGVRGTNVRRCRRTFPTGDALEDAYNAGFNDGFCEGVEAGREEGFCEGFEQGARAGCEDTKEAALNCIRRIRCV